MATVHDPLLEVSHLKTYFYTEDGVVKAVDGVDLTVYPGEVIGLVGEFWLWEKRYFIFHLTADRTTRKNC